MFRTLRVQIGQEPATIVFNSARSLSSCAVHGAEVTEPLADSACVDDLSLDAGRIPMLGSNGASARRPLATPTVKPAVIASTIACGRTCSRRRSKDVLKGNEDDDTLGLVGEVGGGSEVPSAAASSF